MQAVAIAMSVRGGNVGSPGQQGLGQTRIVIGSAAPRVRAGRGYGPGRRARRRLGQKGRMLMRISMIRPLCGARPSGH